DLDLGDFGSAMLSSCGQYKRNSTTFAMYQFGQGGGFAPGGQFTPVPCKQGIAAKLRWWIRDWCSKKMTRNRKSGRDGLQ
ncbi:MAG: hypothetical protein KDJ51_03395, partial [Nitratireductor sp.]|nr:hypothetical protein [Nitratireductor sp.]